VGGFNDTISSEKIPGACYQMSPRFKKPPQHSAAAPEENAVKSTLLTVALTHKLLAHLREVVLEGFDACLQDILLAGRLQASLGFLARKPVPQIRGAG
jgi:hypothetical protein